MITIIVIAIIVIIITIVIVIIIIVNPIKTRGVTLCPPVTYLRITVHVQTHTFLNYEFGIGQFPLRD